MRTIKKPEFRREEIMNVAEELFGQRGVEETSVNDIIGRVGVAKGTFYWYFKSKEELLDALVERGIDRYIEQISPIVGNDKLNAVEKLRHILKVHNRAHGDKKKIHDFFHRTESALAHQKHLIREMEKTAPILAKVIEQGVSEGRFNTRYPREIAEFMLLTLISLINPSAFQWGRENPAARLKALQEILERALGAGPGTLSFLDSLLEIGPCTPAHTPYNQER